MRHAGLSASTFSGLAVGLLGAQRWRRSARPERTAREAGTDIIEARNGCRPFSRAAGEIAARRRGGFGASAAQPCARWIRIVRPRSASCPRCRAGEGEARPDAPAPARRRPVGVGQLFGLAWRAWSARRRRTCRTSVNLAPSTAIGSGPRPGISSACRASGDCRGWMAANTWAAHGLDHGPCLSSAK